MDIKLNNFGKIKEAYIQLNGLTLIAGLNDTGKSTVGKCLFALIKAVNTYPKTYEIIKKKYFYSEYIASLRMKVKNLRLHILKHSNHALDYNKYRILEKFLYSGYLEFDRDSNINNRPLEFDRHLNIEKLHELLKLCEIYKIDNINDIKKTIFEAEEYLNKLDSDKDKIKEACRRILIDIFSGNLNNSLYYQDESTINYSELLKIRIKNDEIDIIGTPELKAISFTDVLFIDNPNILDQANTLQNFYFLAYSDEFTSFTEDTMSKIVNASKKIQKENFNKNLLNFFHNVFSSAKFEYDKSQDKLKYKVSDKAKSLEISNIAMGSKSFGLLYILLKSGVLQKDSLLILDEPENHLHPEWQIKYAEIICKMISEGFYVLITSHSPYFIQALRKYAEIYKILENKTDFYFAEKTNKQNYSIISNVKDEYGNIDTEKIFDSLYKPFETLDNE